MKKPRKILSVLKKVHKAPKNEKEKMLKENESKELKIFMKAAFDKSLKWVVPEGEPPVRENAPNRGGMSLDDIIHKLYIFIEGGSNKSQMEKEMLFLRFWENLSEDEADILVAAKDRNLSSQIKGLSYHLVRKCFPDFIPELRGRKK